MNYRQSTISEVKALTGQILGNSDWIHKNDLQVVLGIKKTQFYNDINLLKSTNIPGFTHFHRDLYFDRTSAEIIICFRWVVSRYRSRGQAIVHTFPLLKAIKSYDEQQQWCHHSTIEVEAVSP